MYEAIGKNGSEDSMLKNKPSRKPRQDIRTVPTYTVPEAAKFLAIHCATLSAWYDGDDPILRASGSIGSIRLLSYRDIEEAYRVHLLREQGNFSLQFLRRSMRNARKMSRSRHPLQHADAVKEFLKEAPASRDIVFDKPARGKNPRTITSLGKNPGQLVVPSVIALFAKRIVEGEGIFPWRFAATDHDSRPVSMNPQIMSGRLVITGTRIPVSVLVEGKKSGKTLANMAKDYGIDSEIIEKALIHIGQVRQKAA